MTAYEEVKKNLCFSSKIWLVTGVAGFIGSNLLEELLLLNQRVIGLDNFSTGYMENIELVKARVPSSLWKNFVMMRGDIRNLNDCNKAFSLCKSLSDSGEHDGEETGCVDYVLHQAALGSVPRSIEDPIATNETNVSGFLNILVAARNFGVKRFVYAASSSTYGDHTGTPKVENLIGRPLSPYAVTKFINELYADIFSQIYGTETIGLRYFNVFGPRQDPDGPYAAVIPRWISAMIQNKQVFINGDGETSRDFCYVANAVQANILAATVKNNEAINRVYNVAVGEATTLNQLFRYIRTSLELKFSHIKNYHAINKGFRVGDVRHSLANIESAKMLLGYQPTHTAIEGLSLSINWYLENLDNSKIL